ncbi:putative 2-aminoethylphosphonate ABC transporter ATP-binding protein [Cupriavidus taiwanensis]|uniref:putative 2-aminoethylphosphonate ABC transporter ATP-binding protein n=1 Tax=Cupriavidus taiwanensis TaxID=164546 RepID=UPI000E1094F8|nr:putative 2-aminoethylphosphonate ABC transporter ATP-binding protein [Cupriavidus taiwanensis]SOY66622.1 putative ABC transporter, ATP-binding component [Cupriavidus taiwanensis]SOY66699.1 putative ABC transporter, ATP-binding component [Cupriavidus taiwanensis]SOY94727.1 putative ABC transporter, ATP-binding component [Cupriavidus taiwanensis]SPA20266.1 putative ABC transporter, ATP-binding component [Cupriavidus taiwanensis]SPD57888.1 Fe(3+) ions import ATP-binding protein FbpC 2 [Cupriav
MQTSTSTAETYLSLKGIHKRFGGSSGAFVALHNIDLDVRQGELLCFLGPSGCGKTTLLRIIAGLESQNAGTIHQGGRDISTLPPMERYYGIVFQSYALFPNLTVADNVAYGLVNRRMPRDRRRARVAELLTLVGLPDRGDQYPAQLSGGQQQRVAIARALATSPGLLLLDEPLSALDARVRVRLRSEIRALQQRLNITTILVTHDQEEALSMADRIVVMNQGAIEQVGTPAQVYQRPATPFAADFVGKTNMLGARVCGDGELHLGGVRMRCAAPAGCCPDEDVQVFFRPEDVCVRGIEQHGPNVLEATVDKIEFLGAFSRLTLRLPDAAPAAAGAAAAAGGALYADLSLNDLHELRPHTGDRLRLAIPADRIRIFRHACA